MARAGTIPRLIGMVHLGPLPGSPGFDGDLDAVVEDAVTDAERLEAAGFEGLMIENFGDAPFFADHVPPVTVAAMSRIVSEIATAVGIPYGINVLRNDAIAALSIAAATDAGFIRVNVLTGSMETDQGPIVGRAAEVVRARQAFAPDVAILADVFVKHATPPPGLTFEQAVADTAARGGADAIVVSGAATGSAPTLASLRAAQQAAAGLPLVVGSGVTTRTVGRMLSIADSVIVGTSIKEDGIATGLVDEKKAGELVAAATRGTS